MLNGNKANESVLMGSRAPVSIIFEYFAAIFQVKIIRGHEVQKVKVLNFGIVVVQNML